jgi:hypothetical protein
MARIPLVERDPLVESVKRAVSQLDVHATLVVARAGTSRSAL